MLRWINKQRKNYSAGKLTNEQAAKLSEIGMVWEFDDPWENAYRNAKQYYEKHGDLNVPKDYVCEDGCKLYVWLANQRRNYKSP